MKAREITVPVKLDARTFRRFCRFDTLRLRKKRARPVVFALILTAFAAAALFSGREQGGVGSVHTHPHCRNTYVRSGRFRFTIDGRNVEVGPGDTIAFPPDIRHGTLCLEAGTLLDIFTPMRENFV